MSAVLVPAKPLVVGLWLAQLVLAVMFISMGVVKCTTPIAELAQKFTWPGEVPAVLVRFIGLAEILGGLGVALPSLVKWKPELTVWAAAGLTVVMLLAAAFHTVRTEFGALPVNAAYAALALFVIWGSRKVRGREPRR